MSPSTTHSSDSVRPRNYSAATHWSVVPTPGASDGTRAHEALARLRTICRCPLDADAGHHRFDPHDAEDLTQEFFERLMQRITWVERSADEVQD